MTYTEREGPMEEKNGGSELNPLGGGHLSSPFPSRPLIWYSEHWSTSGINLPQIVNQKMTRILGERVCSRNQKRRVPFRVNK